MLGKKIKNGFRYVFDKYYRFKIDAYKGKYDDMEDREYIENMFRARLGYKLDLDDPVTFNEKLQWLKLYDHRPEYTTMVDKYAAKKYVADIIGDEYIIPTLGVWERFDDIDFDALPDKFVLKTTHDSGGIAICTDKKTFNFKKAEDVLERSLKNDYYLQSREWPYKDVPKRIIAEQYMVDESGYELKDYKFFCFGGEAKAMFIATDRNDPNTETKFDFFDMDFNHLPFVNGHPNSGKEMKKPASFDKMRAIAEKLSKGLPQVRIDLYDINGKIYFGEITFFHWSGFVKFEPQEWDIKFGEWIKLPEKTR